MKKILIMVVEDEKILQTVIKKKLELSNFEVLTFSHGQKAIEYLNQQNNLPDLIWLDYYLADISGLEFLNSVKNQQNNPKINQIPVIIVSNSASDQKVMSMLSLGAKKYFLKAASKIENIISEINKIIEDEHAKNSNR